MSRAPSPIGAHAERLPGVEERVPDLRARAPSGRRARSRPRPCSRCARSALGMPQHRAVGEAVVGDRREVDAAERLERRLASRGPWIAIIACSSETSSHVGARTSCAAQRSCTHAGSVSRSARVDHDVDDVLAAVDEHVVDRVALLVSRKPYFALPSFILPRFALKTCSTSASRSLPRISSRPMWQRSKSPACAAHAPRLVEDARVLHGHVPAVEVDDAGAGRDVGVVERRPAHEPSGAGEARTYHACVGARLARDRRPAGTERR